MPAGYDAEVAELFRDLRSTSNLSETDLAVRIATPVEVVQALEQGAIHALPPWPETARVVNAYGSLLNLDTRPLLRRIYAQIEAGVVELGPKPLPDVPVMPPQAGGDATFGGGVTPAQAPQPVPQRPPQAAPGQPAWQNGPAAPQQQAPMAPAWPGGAPQGPQGGFAATQGHPQPYPQQAPGAPAWPNGRQGAPQPQAPAADPAAYQPPPQAYPPEAAAPLQGEDAAFGDAAIMGEDATLTGSVEPEPKRKKPALLKWGIGALIASVVLIALWMVLGDSPDSSSSGSFNTSDPVLDPDDPRSRKADRLPNNF